MIEQNVNFPSGNLTLEGVWHWPRPIKQPWPAVAVCHPHPLYGGDMNNNIVLAVCNALAQNFIAAFRFNFRGVGASQGNFGNGIGEREDLKAALSFMVTETRVNKESLGLVGYSFGSTVAVPVAPQVTSIKALALVSPPLGPIGLEPLKAFAMPMLILCGNQDFVVSAKMLQKEIEDLRQTVYCQIIPGADHFWWGYESRLAQMIADFFVRSLL